MKKILIFIFILSAFFAAKAQNTQTVSPASQEARNLNVEVVKLFQQGKFDEALPKALKVVQIREKESGADHIETAKALTNLGFVYYSLKNNGEAEKSFEAASLIFDKQIALKKEEILLAADVLKNLAFIEYSFGKADRAENLFEKALLGYEKAGEKDSLKAGEILYSLGSLKSAGRDFGKASNFFKQALAVRAKKLGEKNSDTLDAFNSSACALKKDGQEKEIQRLQQTFFPGAELGKDGDLKWREDQVEKEAKIVDGAINGIALSLPKPAYPSAARELRASGTVKVKVKINEQGNVVFVCGAFNNVHKALIEASEAAAYEAKFAPTLRAGKPVKIFGVIVYNFIAP